MSVACYFLLLEKVEQVRPFIFKSTTFQIERTRARPPPHIHTKWQTKARLMYIFKITNRCDVSKNEFKIVSTVRFIETNNCTTYV